jgi:3-methyladenine DNA glycosylase AlkC
MGPMDELIDARVVTELTGHLRTGGLAPRDLPPAAAAVDGLPLRRRVDVVRDALLADLPAGHAGAAAVVRSAFGEPSFSGWMLWPVSEAVVHRALATGRPSDFDDAMDVLAQLTTRFTGEFAIRAMLVARLDRALDIARTWTSSPDEHVRRLASEGTRSHLPWAKGVPALVRQDISTRPIVDALYRDESETVRRSAANHVNDLARDHPDLAADIAAGWWAAPDAQTSRVARHALRSLVKKGHPGALAVLGFSGSQFTVDGPHLADDVVRLGSSVHLIARVTNDASEPARVAIDFVLHFQKARGEARPKVFKIGVRTIAPGETVDIAKAYSFRARTTRTFHPGEHVPGAQYADLLTKFSARDGRFPRPSAEQLTSALVELGIDNDSDVVIYDRAGAMWAARLWWVLRSFGIRASCSPAASGPGRPRDGPRRPSRLRCRPRRRPSWTTGPGCSWPATTCSQWSRTVERAWSTHWTRATSPRARPRTTPAPAASPAA